MTDLGNKEVFSNNLKYYLEKNGTTPADVADKLGIKRTTFYGWYQGKAYPRIDKLQMLADFFHINKSDLLEGDDNKLTEQQIKVAHFIDPDATEEEIDMIKKLVEAAKASRRRL